ncbi:hypothetical protein [Trebonia sp.]|uniref:hypothetical protein n=1 Tax=Trebonia sp. TaxID=2767075 RepID=UPI002616A4F3|nr:hypothetical protein [Trebonia sp.]
MTSPMPPWQLTTAELDREVESLEASIRDLPPDEGEHELRRLTQLYAERDERRRLSGRILRPAERRFPDDAS